jgi:site-specific DNA-cytosine methylase
MPRVLPPSKPMSPRSRSTASPGRKASGSRLRARLSRPRAKEAGSARWRHCDATSAPGDQATRRGPARLRSGWSQSHCAGRWALGVRPDWVACEQVPEVLPIWHVVAERLRAEGYSAWAGTLNAADYGVPQTRQRAVLMASRSRPAVPPAATHARRPRVRLDGTGLPSWATMAEALERRGLRSAPLPR